VSFTSTRLEGPFALRRRVTPFTLRRRVLSLSKDGAVSKGVSKGHSFNKKSTPDVCIISNAFPPPRATQVSGSSAIITGNPVSSINKRSIFRNKAPRKVFIKNKLGTELEFVFEQPSPWRHIDGTNIPNEVVPSEISNYTPHVNGRIVFTGVMVSLVPIGKKYGHVKEPVTFDIENGFIKQVNCKNHALQQDLLNIFNYCEGNGEVVELGIGTNSALNLVGLSAPFEERKAGFHLGVGGYQPKTQHIDFVMDDAEIYFDGECIFSNDQFTLDY